MPGSDWPQLAMPGLVKLGLSLMGTSSKEVVLIGMTLMGMTLMGIAAVASSPGAQASDPVTAYPGYTGEYPGFSLVLDDRFDHFDTTVWRRGDGAVGGESKCRFQPQGVEVADGYLRLVVREEPIAAGHSLDQGKDKGPYDYSCGELRTQPDKRIRYGRIETRMKAPARADASGYISSVFTYKNEPGDSAAREWEEIDIELEGGRPDKFQANLIYGLDAFAWSKTREFGAWEDKIEVGPVDEWRVFAIEWLPDRIQWFVDGELVKTLSQADIGCQAGCRPPQERPTPIPDDYADLMANFWIPVDSIEATFGGVKARNAYPMVSQYDWLRYYTWDAEPATSWVE